jgi:hypothetical protein
MKKEDIKIDIDEEHRTLTVSGKVEREKKEKMRDTIALRDPTDRSAELSVYQQVRIWLR